MQIKTKTLVRNRTEAYHHNKCTRCGDLIDRFEDYLLVEEVGPIHMVCAVRSEIPMCQECFMVGGCDCGE